VPSLRILDAANNPARFVVAGFSTLIALGTVLLMLPQAYDDAHPGLAAALFMATSAATVTGLATVDAEAFSLFGELVLLALVQIGGFGIMAIGAVVATVLSNRLGLRQRMLARSELGAVDAGELRGLLVAIAKLTVAVEATIAAVLTVRLWVSYDERLPSAAYSGVFHAITAFNNAGISLYSDNLSRFVGDPVVVLTVTFAIIVGGFGFPVIVELLRRTPVRRWTLHTRLTMLATGALLIVGPLVVLVLEWSNAGTLGQLNIGDRFLAAWFQGVSPRTAGFNTVPIDQFREPTMLFVTTLMFIGAGPASTSGGIKITTFAVLLFVLLAEIRGESDVNVFRRRISPATIRQALTVALLSVAVVVGASLVLVTLADLTLTPALFEAASAFGTVGLSTGVTSTLPDVGQFLLVLLMLAGRVGPITFFTALALRQHTRAYRYPEERPIIG
jgi:trk system potassium uptake protein TrkH